MGKHMAYQTWFSTEDNWLGYYLYSKLLPIHNNISNLFIPDTENKKTLIMKKWYKKPKANIKEILQLMTLIIWLLFFIWILPIISMLALVKLTINLTKKNLFITKN